MGRPVGSKDGIKPPGGYPALDPADGHFLAGFLTSNALPVWLQDAGYYTAQVGRQLMSTFGVSMLDLDPPRGRKGAEFLIWRQAADLSLRSTEMRRLGSRLKAVRNYKTS